MKKIVDKKKKEGGGKMEKKRIETHKHGGGNLSFSHW